VSTAEVRLSGAVGVTADDVVAGLYGLAAGHIAQALI
jgi:phosphatidylglycerophosphatase A